MPFSEKSNVEKLKQQLPERAKKVAALASQSQRMQVLRDLCLVAQADGKVTTKERKLLVSISQQLEVSEAFRGHHKTAAITMIGFHHM